MPPQQDSMTPQSPWMKVLASLQEADQDQQRRPMSEATPIGGSSTQLPPAHRIEDDRTAGTRGVTPQSPTTGNSDRYAGAAFASTVPLSDQGPLPQQITADRTELARMNQPTKVSLKQRVMRGVGAGLAGMAGQTDELNTLRDRMVQRNFEQKQALANRISENTKSMASEDIATKRMMTQEDIEQSREDARASNLAATISGQNQRNANTVAGANERNQNTVGAENQRASTALGSRLDMFKQSQDYLRWKAQLDNQTKIKVAELTAGKAPAALVQTAVFANGGLTQLQNAQSAMERLQQKGVMGSLPVNWIESYLFGNNMVDPRLDPETRRDIGQLKAALNYTSSAAMRAHTGRTSQEIYNDFKQTLGPGQDWDALRGAIDETNGMLTQYAGAASNQNMQSIRQGTNVSGGGQPPLSNRIRPPDKPGFKIQQNKATGEYRQVPIQ